MKKRSKKFTEALSKITADKHYSLDEAIDLENKHGIHFEVNFTTRWKDKNDIYKPRNELLYKKRPEQWKILKKHY